MYKLLTRQKNIRNFGFTLLELMLVISVASIILASSFVFYQYAYLRENGKDVKNIVWNALSTARSYALSNRENSNWGVAFATSTVIIFKGTTFSGRDSNFDELFEYRGAIVSGLTEIYFSKRSATTTGNQSIVVSNDQNSYTFSINSLGRISVQ